MIQDKLIAQMNQKSSDEEMRINTALAEREAAKAAEETEKEAKRARMLESIREHRIEQVLRISCRISVRKLTPAQRKDYNIIL